MASTTSSMIIGDSRPTRQERALEMLRVLVVNAAFAALVLIVGYVLLVIYETKQQETWQKKQDVESARTQLQRDVTINEALRRHIAFLKTEAGVEKVARDRLGLVRPNESSYVVVNAPPAQAPAVRPESVPSQTPPSGGVFTRAWRVVLELWNGGE